MAEKIAPVTPRSRGMAAPALFAFPPSIPPGSGERSGLCAVGNGVPQITPAQSGRDGGLSNPHAPSKQLGSSQWVLPGNCLQTRCRAGIMCWLCLACNSE